MMPRTDPDYSLYNLEQLYEILRETDNEQYPERVVSVRQAIALKDIDDLETQSYPPCLLLMLLGAKRSSVYYEPGNALRIARSVVNMEFGALVLLVGYPAFVFLASMAPAFMIAAFLIYMLLSSGVAIFSRLNSVRDPATVELWSLIALGLAPFSTMLYGAITAYALHSFPPGFFTLHMLLLSLLPSFLIPLAGFYTPFVLVTLWVKYHYREDEF